MRQDVVPAFFCDWLTAQGALFEAKPEIVEALLEPQTSQLLGCPESARFVFSPQIPGRFVGIGSEILETVLTHVSREVPVAFVRLEGYSLRGKNVDRDLARDFTFLHCTPGGIDTVVASGPFTRLIYRLSMQSDEAREVLLQVDCFERNRRLLSGGPEFPPDVEMVPLGEDDPRLRDFLLLTSLQEEVQTPLKVLVEEESRKFQQTLWHRMNLDLNRVSGYFSGLLDGLESRRAKKSLTGEEYDSKKTAITQDFHKQIEDLRRKYGLRVQMVPVAVLRMLLPILLVRVTMKIGKGRTVQEFYWSPLSRSFEPFFCPVCRTHGATVAGTRKGGLLCPACASKS